jgi:hypothetical protein
MRVNILPPFARPSLSTPVIRSSIILLLAMSIASCSLTDRFRRPSQLEAVPSGEVTSSPLEVTPTARPESDETSTADADNESDPLVTENQSAVTQTAASAPNVNRADLIGAWTMRSSGTNCQLILTLTTWAGGYRATTRGCGADSLGGITAWSLDGKQIVLKGSDQATIAVLFASTNQRYDGRTTGGNDISFSR